MPDVLTAADARHWAALARAALAARRTEIDGLNVFPVPDGDTGTNLYLTLDNALERTSSMHAAAGVLGRATLTQESRALARAVVLAARGNSGVIMSQVIGGMCAAILAEGSETLDARLLARGLTDAAAQARAAVAHPQEGTILSVLDAAAHAAEAQAAQRSDLAGTAAAVSSAARAALVRTPEQMALLRDAGVVDAGGAGLVLLLEALERVVTDTWHEAYDHLLGVGADLGPRPEWHRHPARALTPATDATASPDGSAGPSGPADPTDPARAAGATTRPGGHTAYGATGRDDRPGLAVRPAHDPTLAYDDGPDYEVVFLLEETTQARVDTLASVLDPLGDSLVVVGGPEVWKIHVHVDDVGAVIEAAITAGRPREIDVTYLTRELGRDAHGRLTHRAKVGVVACAVGDGVEALMARAGATVVRSGPGARASTGQLLDAAHLVDAEGVIILPNDKDTLLAAEAACRAAREEGLSCHVIPARATVQGLAALAVLEPTATLHENAVTMTGAAATTRHGAVTIALRQALTWAGECQPGDALGMVDGDVAVIGTDLQEVTVDVLTRLLAGGGELVTLVAGADATPDLVGHAERWLRREHRELETVTIEGGQPIYPLLIGVE